MARIPEAVVVAFHFLVAVVIAAAIGRVERLVARHSLAALLDSWELWDKISHTLLLVQVRDRLPLLQGDELTR